MPELEAASSLQLSKAEREIVGSILQAKLPCARVWVFGSRVTGTARPFSDLDLGIEEESLSLAKRAELVEAFEESDLPFRVDVVDLSKADRLFAERVRRTGVLWPGAAHADAVRGDDNGENNG